MQKIKFVIPSLLIFFLFAFCLAVAQDEDPHVFTVTALQLLNPEGGTFAEFDSLNTIYMENVINKNEFILSQRSLQHLWGSNSQDYVYITEYARFGDIEKGNDRNTELFREAWITTEERRAYNQAIGKYFGTHSDEIYQEDAVNRK